jgi:hypothetical protein
MNIIYELVNGSSTIILHPDGSATLTQEAPTELNLRAAREIVRLHNIVAGLVRVIRSGDPFEIHDVTVQADVIDVEVKIV